MKRMIFGLLCFAAAMLVGCKNDTAEQNSWFQQPAPAEVSGTSATLSCVTTFGEGVLTPANAGIAYAPVQGEGIGSFVEAPNPIISGNVITCRLTDLDPETTYLYYAYVLMGAERMQSPTMTFITGQSGETPPPPVEGEPTFTTPIASDVSSSGASVSCRFAYEGQKTISKVYFLYNTTERVELTTEQGNKSAQLSGLSASTAYTFCLCVEIDGVSYSSGKSSFTTLSVTPPPTPGDAKFSGWAELPVEVSNPDYYYAYHICPSFRVGGHLARNYTVCYSAEHHCPVWVAAPLHDCYVGGSGNRNYGPDPDIPSSIQPSSKTIGSPYNKGHMLGNRERSGDSGMNKQVSYFTNMAAQHATSFNTGGGAWNNLEDYIDGLWCNDTLYMVSGCRFEAWTDTYGNTAQPKKADFGGKKASVPTAFYYVLLRTKKGTSGKSVINCTADELQCVGFVISHAMPKGHEPASTDMRSVKWIEDFTGQKFFTNVPNAPKDTYKASDWGL